MDIFSILVTQCTSNISIVRTLDVKKGPTDFNFKKELLTLKPRHRLTKKYHLGNMGIHYKNDTTASKLLIRTFPFILRSNITLCAWNQNWNKSKYNVTVISFKLSNR